jgi:hypothetical protein
MLPPCLPICSQFLFCIYDSLSTSYLPPFMRLRSKIWVLSWSRQRFGVLFFRFIPHILYYWMWMAIYDFGHLVYETNCLVLLITNLPILHVTRESMTPRMTLLRETISSPISRHSAHVNYELLWKHCANIDLILLHFWTVKSILHVISELLCKQESVTQGKEQHWRQPRSCQGHLLHQPQTSVPHSKQYI